MTAMSSARPAATIMILRSHQSQIEVLLLKRSRQVGFFPSTWVFPGGRVDAADAVVQYKGKISGLDDPAFAVAGVRECFEEAGIWLGEGHPSATLRDALNAREATLLDAPELIPNLSRLSWWSWWTTPTNEPKRYDTRFFLCCLSETEMAEASPDNSELVQSRWITPQDALQLHQEGDFFLAPPTLICLQELCDFTDLTSLWEASERRQPTEIMPTHRKVNGRLEILFPNHPDHPEPKVCGLHRTGVLLDEQRRWQPLD